MLLQEWFCYFTFEEEIGFGQVQLVTKGCCSFLHPCAGFKFYSDLQLQKKKKLEFLVLTNEKTKETSIDIGTWSLALW